MKIHLQKSVPILPNVQRFDRIWKLLAISGQAVFRIAQKLAGLVELAVPSFVLRDLADAPEHCQLEWSKSKETSEPGRLLPGSIVADFLQVNTTCSNYSCCT